MTWTDFMQRLIQRRQPTAADVHPAALVQLQAELSALRSATDAGAIREAMDSYDGFVREAALFRCAELGEVRLLPAVVERLNDWVPQIRHVARSVMLELLPAADGELALSLLPTVQRLANATREDHSAWIARFERALLDKVGTETLLDASRTAELKIARACFQLLSHHEVIDRQALTEMALASRRDVVLAMQALHAFAPRGKEARPEAQDIYWIALRSIFGAVRAQALRWLLWASTAEVDERIVIDALLDSHSGARGAAAFYLREKGFDVRGHYRRAAGEDSLPARCRVVALQSLASLRDAADVPFVQDFTRSDLASLRKAAWLGLLKMTPQDGDAIALAMLHDDERFVRAAALRLVKRQGAYIATEVAAPILVDRGDVDLLLALVQGSRWSWLDWLARLARDTPANTPLHGMLAASLDEWANEAGSRFDRPTGPQLAALSDPASRSALAHLAGESGEARRQLAIAFERLERLRAGGR